VTDADSPATDRGDGRAWTDADPEWTVPPAVEPGDRVAVLSPASNLRAFPHVHELGLERLRSFGVEPVEYPTATADSNPTSYAYWPVSSGDWSSVIIGLLAYVRLYRPFHRIRPTNLFHLTTSKTPYIFCPQKLRVAKCISVVHFEPERYPIMSMTSLLH